MHLSKYLQLLLKSRVTWTPGWFAAEYEKAMGKVEEDFDYVRGRDSANSGWYWYSPATDYSVWASAGLVMDGRFEYDPDVATAKAFELLVLADLARCSRQVPREAIS